MLEAIELCNALHSGKDGARNVDALVKTIIQRTSRQIEMYIKEREHRIEKIREEILTSDSFEALMREMFERYESKPDVLASIILHFATKEIVSKEDLEHDHWSLGSFGDAFHGELDDEHTTHLNEQETWERSKHAEADALLPPTLSIGDVSSAIDHAFSLLRGSSGGSRRSVDSSPRSSIHEEKEEDGVLQPLHDTMNSRVEVL